MKKLFLFLNLIVLFILNDAFGQAGEWVWIHGSNNPNSLGNYGTQGVSSPGNEPPALYEACEWTDLNGKFWLYGGQDLNNDARNDLWKYDPLTNEWTWMTGTNSINDPGVYGSRGVPSPANRPPSRKWAAASWVDLNGNFWVFGGDGGISGPFNDLWKFDVTTNEWTWMKGSSLTNQTGIYGTRGIPDTSNNPCSRWECASSWTDNAGDLWIFGGNNNVPGTLNDMWRFNIAGNCWTWMKGSNLPNPNGVYGTLGVEDTSNNPCGRAAYCHWKDNTGNLWLFGGFSFSANSGLSDLWKYNISTNNWTWMSGSDTADSQGKYGIKCTMSISNFPGYRFENRAAWKDQDGNLWLFGGWKPNTYDAVNDLWKYCITTNQWAWISGDSTSNSTGNWGTLGVASPANKPNCRAGSDSWTDNNGHLYFFGGSGQGGNFHYNDLWKFTIDTTCAPCVNSVIPPTANFISSDSSICSGECLNFTNLSQHSISYHWIFQGATPSTDTSANPHGICYFNSGTFDVTLIASNSNGSDTLTLPNFITIYPQVPFSALTQNGDTLFSIPGYPSYEWYDGSTIIPGATNYNYVATHSGNYSVVVTDSNGCFATAQMLNVIATVNNINSEINDFNVQYSSGNILLKINSSNMFLSDIEITDGIGKIIYQNKISVEKGKNEFEISGLYLSEGVYFIKLMNSKEAMTRKIFIQQNEK